MHASELPFAMQTTRPKGSVTANGARASSCTRYGSQAEAAHGYAPARPTPAGTVQVEAPRPLHAHVHHRMPWVLSTWRAATFFCNPCVRCLAKPAEGIWGLTPRRLGTGR
eukprot:359938-Chlamydomonas_euryale.AAC.7